MWGVLSTVVLSPDASIEKVPALGRDDADATVYVNEQLPFLGNLLPVQLLEVIVVPLGKVPIVKLNPEISTPPVFFTVIVSVAPGAKFKELIGVFELSSKTKCPFFVRTLVTSICIRLLVQKLPEKPQTLGLKAVDPKTLPAFTFMGRMHLAFFPNVLPWTQELGIPEAMLAENKPLGISLASKVRLGISIPLLFLTVSSIGEGALSPGFKEIELVGEDISKTGIAWAYKGNRKTVNSNTLDKFDVITLRNVIIIKPL